MSISRWMLLALAAGCGSSNSDKLPVPGGGTGIDASVQPDAPPKPRDAPTTDGATASDGPPATISGRVCLVTANPTKLGLDPANDCASTGASGLAVQLGSRSTTTAADGTFTIDSRDAKAGAVWIVTGASIVSSYMVLSDYQIPALTKSLYQTMTASPNDVILLPGQGSVIAQIVQNGSGAAGKAAVSAPTAEYDPFYDGSQTTPTTFVRSQTSGAGFVWVPGLDVGTASVTVGTPGTTLTNTISSPSLPIIDGAITFVTLTFP